MDYHCQIQQREIMPKVRKAELSFLYATRRLVLFYISTKHLRNTPGYSSYRADMKSFSNKTKGETPIVRQPELSILYATRRLVLIYTFTKYHQIFQRVFKLQSGQEVLRRRWRQCQRDPSQKQYPPPLPPLPPPHSSPPPRPRPPPLVGGTYKC